jgi:hypothetical protein
LIIGVLISCDDKKEDISINLTSGIYMGYFDYQGTKYWCEICFDSSRYEEWPSGGVWFQKPYSCLTVGDYTIIENKIIFTLDSFKFPGFPEPCVSDMLLPGEYTIYNTNKTDSITFERGKDSNKIKYYLERLITNK